MVNYESLFVLGNPRSGTSLFRLMLNNHPEIVAPPECGFAHWWLPKYSGWSKIDCNLEKINMFLTDLFSSKKFETWYLDRTVLKDNILKNEPSNFSDLVALIYIAYAEKASQIKIVADKNNYFIDHIEDLSKIWPEAKYVHMIRDGRDVACSYLEVDKLESNSPYKPNLPVSIADIAREWSINNQKIALLNELGQDKYIQIKYEDLILHTEDTLSLICQFLELPYSSQMLNYYKKNVHRKTEPTQTLDWKKKTQELPDPKKIGRYLDELSVEEIDIFNSIAGKTLKDFDYE